jgi:hypothetical protein
MTILDLKIEHLRIGPKNQNGDIIENISSEFDKISIVGGDHRPN